MQSYVTEHLSMSFRFMAIVSDGERTDSIFLSPGAHRDCSSIDYWNDQKRRKFTPQAHAPSMRPLPLNSGWLSSRPPTWIIRSYARPSWESRRGRRARSAGQAANPAAASTGNIYSRVHRSRARRSRARLASAAPALVANSAVRERALPMGWSHP